MQYAVYNRLNIAMPIFVKRKLLITALITYHGYWRSSHTIKKSINLFWDIFLKRESELSGRFADSFFVPSLVQYTVKGTRLPSVITHWAPEQLRCATATLNDTHPCSRARGQATSYHYALTVRYCVVALSIIRYIRSRRHGASVGRVKGETGRPAARPLDSRPHTPTECLDTLSRHTSVAHYRPLAFQTFS